MRIRLRQQNILKQLLWFLDKDAVDAALAAFAHDLIGVNIGALCCLAMDFEFLKTFLHPLPVFPVEILEDAGTDQQETFLDAMNAGVGRVGFETILFETVVEPVQEGLAGIVFSFGFGV